MVSDVTASVKLPAAGVTSAAAVATPITTKANSPPGPSSRAVSIAAVRGTRKRRASPNVSTALMPISPATQASSHTGSRASSRKSMAMPTVKKNRPSSRPLNGSIVVSIALRNSVSGQQQAGDEGAERHRHAGEPGDYGGGDDDEQGRRHEQLARARGGHQAEQRLEQQPPDDHDDAERQGRVGHRQRQPGCDGAAGAVS